jgi:O-antigen/teichoic acid export membrane protein
MTSVDAPTPSLVARVTSTARSSVVVSASFLLANLLGGTLLLLIAVIVGEGPDTDGFLAAYSAYLTFLLFGSTLRVALVPLLGPTADEGAFRVNAIDSVRRLIAAGLIMSAALAAASPLLGRILVPSAPGDAKVTATLSVAILAVAAGCQIWAAALAAVLAAARRFTVSAMLYATSSAVTVSLAAALMATFGVRGAAVGVLASAVGLLGAHMVYLRRFGFAVAPQWRTARERNTWKLVIRAAAGASVPIVFQVNLSIALAAVSGTAGAVTGYAYAYFLAITLSGVTASTLGLTTMPQLVQALSDQGRRVARAYLIDVAPFGAFLFLPLAAGYAFLGHPFVHAVLGRSLTPATIDLLWDTSRIFMIMALTWAIFTPATTLALSMQRFGGLALVSATVGVTQIVLVLVARSHGPVAVAVAHGVSGALLVILALVLVFHGEAPRAALAALWRCLPAGAFALVFPAFAVAGFDRGLARAAAALVVGGAMYLALSVRLWPSVGGRAVRLLRSRI